jgi:predicted transcriptional regulator
MRHLFSPKERKALRLKMATVFSEETQMLSRELREILLDDLITALESRLNVLDGAQFETYVDILSALAHRGPSKLAHIRYKAKVNRSLLSEYLAFLVQRELVEEGKDEKNRKVYAITQRGIKVLKYFGELKQLQPIAKEERKQLPPLF